MIKGVHVQSLSVDFYFHFVIYNYKQQRLEIISNMQEISSLCIILLHIHTQLWLYLFHLPLND